MAKQESNRVLSFEELRVLAQTSPSGLAWVTNLQKSSKGIGTYKSQSRWIHAHHVDYLDEILVRLAAREFAKQGFLGVIVEEPPRHGKSELGSHYFPAWYLGARPDDRVILCSYEAEFAASWGGKARN